MAVYRDIAASPARTPAVVVAMVAMAAMAAMVGLGGCAAAGGGAKPRVYEQESFDTRGAFSREFVAAPADTCNAARRALLSQGYVVQAAGAEQMEARKRFQPDAETHVQIDFSVVCAPLARGQQATIAFVSAIQDRYVVKKTSTSASVGVGPIGSISVPFTSGSDSLVKVASETIPAGRFYERFFDLVEHHLAEQQGLVDDVPVRPTGVAAPPGG
jgi:hypothetical protein